MSNNLINLINLQHCLIPLKVELTVIQKIRKYKLIGKKMKSLRSTVGDMESSLGAALIQQMEEAA